MTKLTRAQKEELLFMLWNAAGDLIEFWPEYLEGSPNSLLQGLTESDLADQFYVWLKRLPGNVCDTRITNYISTRPQRPPRRKRKR